MYTPFFGAATFIRDNLLSSAAVAKLQILKYLPSWSVWEWLGVALLGAWIITLEGAYRLASDLEAKLKDKYTWSEIRSRLKEFVRSGNELIVRIEEYDTPGVGPIFYLQDVVEQWVVKAYTYLEVAFPRESTSFYGDFDKYRQQWEKRRTDPHERERIALSHLMFTVQDRQFLSGLIKEKITYLEGLMRYA